MNSLQIDRILKAYKPLKGVYKGAFPSNQLPSPNERRPFCFIANTMRAGTAGEHWVACYCEAAGVLEYFDSLAEEPTTDMQRFISNFKHVRKCSDALQSILSDACGHYCIYFLVKRRKSSFRKILHGLHRVRMVAEREHLVKRFVQTLAIAKR